MAVNLKKFTAAGADIVFYGTRDSTGYLQGGTASAPSNGDADGSPMLRMEGVKTWPHTVTEPETVTVTGDDGLLSQYQFEPIEFPSFVVEFGTRDLTLEALAQSTSTYDIGDSTVGIVQPVEPTYPDMIFIVQSQAKSRASGSKNAASWETLLIPNAQMVPLSRDSFAERSAGTIRYRVTTNASDTFPWGEALTEGNQGCTEAAAFVITSENRIHMHRYSGDGATAAFNLDYTPVENSSDKIHVYVDGTVQVYTTDYTVSGTVVTFATGSIPAAGEKIIVWFEYSG